MTNAELLKLLEDNPEAREKLEKVAQAEVGRKSAQKFLDLQSDIRDTVLEAVKAKLTADGVKEIFNGRAMRVYIGFSKDTGEPEVTLQGAPGHSGQGTGNGGKPKAVTVNGAKYASIVDWCKAANKHDTRGTHSCSKSLERLATRKKEPYTVVYHNGAESTESTESTE